MRAFWILIGLLVLGAAAFALLGKPPSREAPKPTPTPDAQVDASTAAIAAVTPEASVAKPSEPDAPTTPPSSAATPDAPESLESLRKRRADVLMRVQELREQASQLELSVQRLPDRAESLEEKLAGVRAEIRTLETQADALAAKIGAAAVRSLAEADAAAAAGAPQNPGQYTAPTAGQKAGHNAGHTPVASTKEIEQAAADMKADNAPPTPAAPGNLADFAAPARIAGFEVLPAKLAVRPQGGVLVDERFVVTGNGTQPDPFIVPWEMLTSAEDAFAPQSGKKQIPQRVAMLDGKYVRVKGYVAFPLAMDQPRELLAMLNQWDGCCIGVPPTPYDAIEVQLKAPAQGDDRFAISGEIAGRFGVKPYVVGDWLVGLYVMENAEFKARGAPGS